MIMGAPAIELVQALVDDARLGRDRALPAASALKQSGGFFYEPTVLDGVTPEMRIASEGVFGPVMAMYEWESERELLGAVNGCRFGLRASVFRGDQRSGEVHCRRVAGGHGECE